MPSPTAAFPLLIDVAPDSAGSPGTYATLNNTTKFDFGPKQTLVDSTYFTGAGATNRFPTLVDGDCSLSGQFQPGAASSVVAADTAQNTLFASIGATDPYVWLKFLWSGATHGPSMQCILDSFKISGAVAGVFEWSCSPKFNSKPVYA